MANKFWNSLYRLPKVNQPKWRYKTRKAVEKFAESRGATVQWDYYNRGLHKVKFGDDLDAVYSAYDSNEAWDTIEQYGEEPNRNQK
jgi:hypothetical protein